MGDAVGFRIAAFSLAAIAAFTAPAAAQEQTAYTVTLDTAYRNVCRIVGSEVTTLTSLSTHEAPEGAGDRPWARTGPTPPDKDSWTDGYVFTARREGGGLVFAVEPLFEEPPRALVWTTANHDVLGEIETDTPLAEAVRPAPNDPRFTPLAERHAFIVLDWFLDGRSIEPGASLYTPALAERLQEWDWAVFESILDGFEGLEVQDVEYSDDYLFLGLETGQAGRLLLSFGGQARLAATAVLDSQVMEVSSGMNRAALFDPETGLLVSSTERQVITGQSRDGATLNRETLIVTTCRAERL